MSNETTLGGSNAGRAPFILCPPGLQQAVCCDYVDHGNVKVPKYMRPGEFAIQHKGTLRWQSQHKMADGKPFIVQRRFTISAHPKAAIRAFLSSWKGKALTEDEAKKFVIERLIGMNAMILVTHVDKPARGGIFQEVMMAAPVPRGVAKLIVDPNYIRIKDRPKDAPADGRGQPAAAGEGSDHDPGYPSEWDSVQADPGSIGAAPDQPNEDPEDRGDWPI